MGFGITKILVSSAAIYVTSAAFYRIFLFMERLNEAAGKSVWYIVEKSRNRDPPLVPESCTPIAEEQVEQEEQEEQEEQVEQEEQEEQEEQVEQEGVSKVKKREITTTTTTKKSVLYK